LSDTLRIKIAREALADELRGAGLDRYAAKADLDTFAEMVVEAADRPGCICRTSGALRLRAKLAADLMRPWTEA
jgi:hypothetical protein